MVADADAVGIPADRPESDDGCGRTVATIRYELELLARRHSHLLALCRDSHASNNGDNGTEPTATGTAKTKNKQRKRLLEARHASLEFHGTYPDDDEFDPSGGAGKSGYYLALFDEFARVVCQTAVIPRKELFEAWAMALYVHFYFPSSPEDDETGELPPSQEPEFRGKTYYKRIADMGCGHGLVSWAILFLDKSQTRTAVCIDKRIPKSCDIIQRVMMERYPSIVEFQQKEIDEDLDDDYEDIDEEQKDEVPREPRSTSETFGVRAKREAAFKRWHWVEGDICRNISADSSTLIVGVHCCGTLSDTILDLAISSRSALALVPCCHTRKSLAHKYRNSPQKVKDLLAENARKNEEMIRSSNGNGNGKDADNNDENAETRQPVAPIELLPTTVTDCVDRLRIQKLRDAGFDVQEETIPSVITPKNRIIVAIPPPTEDLPAGNGTTPSHTAERFEDTKNVFRIPLADTSRARSIVASQSGRIASDLRKRRSPPNLSLSLYLPDPETSMTTEKLNKFSDEIVIEEQHRYFPDACNTGSGSKRYANDEDDVAVIKTFVKYGSKGPYAHPEEGRFSRSFHIRYEVNDPTGKLPQVTKAQAKALHTVVCKRISENAFPGITLRQGIR